MSAARIVGVALFVASLASCTSSPEDLTGLSSFRVEVLRVNGAAPPTRTQPLRANRGDTTEAWEFSIEAKAPNGEPLPFDGLVRLSVRPGSVVRIDADGGVGRNVRLVAGKATGTVVVTGVYGGARLWVEDLGYTLAPLDRVAACSNGQDDDGDELIDFPSDPGCAFPDDDDEEGGTFAAGISPPIAYALPTLVDAQGEGSTTPYPFEGMQLNTDAPQHVVVTRVASDGFYVTDLADQTTGYNHMFAFNFSTPPGMRVCDRVTYLAGTINEFFGFTELSFPSYTLDYVYDEADCEVPEPALVTASTIFNAVAMEKLESGLVRIEGAVVPKHFGPGKVKDNAAQANASSCDFNDDGAVDFADPAEGNCAAACDMDPDCTEFTAYVARGNYAVAVGGRKIQINTSTVSGFDPRSHKGETLDAVTGTLRNFSGGKLNWTVETRCTDDLVCQGAGCVTRAAISSKKACVRLRSLSDNDQGTN